MFAVWRIAHLALDRAFGGGGVDAAFQWDGVFYRRIFQSGYHLGPHEGAQATAFFPGTPWLARAIDLVAPSATSAQLLAVNIAAAAAFLTVWGVAREWRSPQVAWWTVVLLALFPASVFLWSFYSEALFIALGAAAVWADRRDRTWLAAVFLAATSTTRTIGFTVGVVLVIARLVRTRRIDRVAIVYSVGTALGLGTVMATQWAQMGDFFAWTKAQRYWERRTAFPWVWITDGTTALVHHEHGQRILDLFTVAALVATILWAWLWRRPPWPLTARLLPIAFVVVPLCAPTPESSLNRFTLAAWPSFVIGADMLLRAPRWLRVGVVGALTLGTLLFTHWWAHGKFLG